MPSKNQEASTCADALMATWISKFGVSHIGSSDRGTQLCSPTWKALCSQLGMEHVTTHTTPKATVWWIMSTDKSRTCLGPGWPGHINPPEHLPWALLSLRAVPKEDSAISSGKLVFGVPLHHPGLLASEVGGGGSCSD